MDEPLSNHDARRLIREILATGAVRFTRHATERMAERKISEVDVMHALKGAVTGCDLMEGSWRYHVQGRGVVVIVLFRGNTVVVVVTTWRV